MEEQEKARWPVLEQLVGKTLEKVYINASKDALIFKCKEGLSHVVVYNDCCSEGWIEHVTNLGTATGKIESIEGIELGEVMPTKQDVDLLYGVIFKFENGCGRTFRSNNFEADSFIEFRNSSNGYYGSHLELKECEEICSDFKELTEDF